MKFQLTNVSIKNRLIFFPAIILFFFSVLTVFSFYFTNKLSNYMNLLYSNPLQSTNASVKAGFHVSKMENGLAALVMARNEHEINSALADIKSSEESAYMAFDLMRETILGEEGVQMVNETLRNFASWKPIRNGIVSAMLNERRDEALRIYRNENAIYVDMLNLRLIDLQAYSFRRADSYMENILKTENSIQIIWILVTLLTFVLVIILTRALTKSILNSLRLLQIPMAHFSITGILEEASIEGDNEIADMALSYNKTISRLKEEFWMKDGQNNLNRAISSAVSTEDFGSRTLSFLTPYIDAGKSVFYLFDSSNRHLTYISGYAVVPDDLYPLELKLGEGICGQVAMEKKAVYMNNLQEESRRIDSALISAPAKELYCLPLVFEDRLYGVLEFISCNSLDDQVRTFLNQVGPSIASYLNTLEQQQKIELLLDETKESNAELEAQSEELRVLNEELGEKTTIQKEQQAAIQEKNDYLEQLRVDLVEKADQLEKTNQYKTDFLSNMSHELRTPLNSILILSRDFMENRHDNLDSDQMEAASVINKSGKDLLQLINEILDLSKVESGRVELNIQSFNLNTLIENMKKLFTPLTEEKRIKFNLKIESDLPQSIKTDETRLEQILKNLLSNAVKFTDQGHVDLCVQPYLANDWIEFIVRDTGSGIPEEDRDRIFTPFEQAKGTSSQNGLGTGLGLSISKKLAELLSGSLTLESSNADGSVFSLRIPVITADESTGPELIDKTQDALNPVMPEAESKPIGNMQKLSDDRDHLDPNKKTVLIIEDDPSFSAVLMKYAKEEGFQCVTAFDGETGLDLVEKYRPSAIILDLMLPGLSGTLVLERIKENPMTRHIPVHIISGSDEKFKSLQQGSIGFLRKPVEKEDLQDVFKRLKLFINTKIKNLLLVEDDYGIRLSVRTLLSNDDLNIIEATTAEEALKIIESKIIHCMILDLKLPDMSGEKLLEKLSHSELPHFPVIVYSGKDLSRTEEAKLREYADSIIIKGVVSPERLLEETALFLHRVQSSLNPAQKEMIREAHDPSKALAGKKIMVVDDDMRNVFALSKILRDRDIIVEKAENGLKALDLLKKSKGFDLILMDIMMPEMDGLEAIRRIRANPEWAKIPVIALTAKAMKGDKSECIKAGANDYITKPIDTELLISAIRVWLYR